MTRVPQKDPLIDEELFDDPEEQEEDAPAEVDKATFLAHYMSSLNFQPKNPRHPEHIEYCRTYSDPNGKTARAVAVIGRDTTGLQPDKPEYFTVTVQITIPATREDIEKRAPAFVRTDLIRILSAFADKEKRKEAFEITCVGCNQPTSEFLERNGEQLCLPCIRKRVGH